MEGPRPPHRPASVVVALVALLATAFAASYSLALGRPRPHDVATGLVGSVAGERALVASIERATGSGLRLRQYPSVAAARAAMRTQRVYATLVLDGRRPRLLVASAAGSSVARLLEQTARQVRDGQGRQLEVEEVAPLPPEDPNGLVAFYVTLAATIAGFLAMFQLRANAAALDLRHWLAWAAVLAVAVGLGLALVSGPVLGALRGSFTEKWALLAMESAAAAMFNSTMLVLIGRWAILPTWLLFVLLGNSSSGGAVAPPLLPPVYELLGRWLPPGATVDAVRTAAYFPHAQHAEPVLVLAGWVLGGLAALLVAVRLTGRRPSGSEG